MPYSECKFVAIGLEEILDTDDDSDFDYFKILILSIMMNLFFQISFLKWVAISEKKERLL